MDLKIALNILNAAALSALAFSISGRAQGQQSESPQTHRQTEESFLPKDKSQGYRYLLYNPSSEVKEKKTKWPLLIFLHGRGERGNNLDLVKKHGPPKILENKDLPFIIASPQCPRTDLWWKPDVVAGLVDELLGKYPVDPDKVYLTGLSQGGFGTWATAARHPEKFAAVAPVCGGGKTEWAKKFGPSQFGTFMGMPTKSYQSV